MGTARSIASIIATSMGSGTKILAKTWWAIRKGRGEVKKGARTFYDTLVASGIPSEEAKEIAVAYAEPAWELLSVRNLIRLAIESDGGEVPPLFYNLTA
ncbi:MAG: hypothetical protein E4H14_06345 [Candidatus Thorarchaeota archaeon]|nr:MAG: hypothetical protein E4H14_06345 [Candidatus Thorarchaeota archaeon]